MAAFSTYYDYWEKAIQEWFTSDSMTTYDWTDPSKTPLWNKLPSDSSEKYIPEPWWGNHDCNTELHSVVINFNPGAGGCKQCKSSIPSTNRSSYAKDIVGNSTAISNTYLPDTAAWHYGKRAKPIFDALKANGVSLSSPTLGNHLSIELIPWHTEHATSAYGFNKYLNANIKAIYDHCICFAAEASKNIKNGILDNVVIVRMSGANTEKVFKKIHEQMGIGYKSLPPISLKTNSNVKYRIFQLDNCDVKFVCIWQSRGWHANDFPAQPSLNEIIAKIPSL